MTLMTKNKYISIAIDGAAGSGKSTTSKSLCEKFNYIHVDTGLHYRSVCHFLKNINISAENVKSYLDNNTLEIDSLIDGYSCLLQINGNIYNSDLLRTECMNQNVSYYARLPEIRSLLLSYQRGLPMFCLKSGFSGMIMDGRDIGSVVLPNADLKFFLHADLSIRESRRTADGESSNLSKRDSIDTQRKIAPLVCPAGAISLDTGILPINKVVSRISDEIISIL
jgi:cytidylate kinase